MTRLAPALLLAAGLALSAASSFAAPAAPKAAASSDTPATVTGFNQTSLTLYQSDGTMKPGIAASAFKPPINTVMSNSGLTAGMVALPYQGTTLYAHVADLKMQQPPACAQVASAAPTRPTDTTNAATRLGNGASANCKVTP